MGVSAKFTVRSAEPYGNGVQVKLTPDYGTAEEPKNAEWAQATPAGEIMMVIDNPAAAEQFVVGREFTVLFT